MAFIGGARMGFGQLFFPTVAEQEDDNLWELELMSATLPKALSDTGSIASRVRDRYGIPVEFTESGMDERLRWLQAGSAIPRQFPQDAHVYSNRRNWSGLGRTCWRSGNRGLTEGLR